MYGKCLSRTGVFKIRPKNVWTSHEVSNDRGNNTVSSFVAFIVAGKALYKKQLSNF